MPNGARGGAALRRPRISRVAGRPAPLLEVVEHVRNRVELTEVKERTLKKKSAIREFVGQESMSRKGERASGSIQPGYAILTVASWLARGFFT